MKNHGFGIRKKPYFRFIFGLFNVLSLVWPCIVLYRRLSVCLSVWSRAGDIVERVYEFVELLGWTKEFDEILASKSSVRRRHQQPSDAVPSYSPAGAGDDDDAADVTESNVADTNSRHRSYVGSRDDTTERKLQSAASNGDTRRSDVTNWRSRGPMLPSLKGRSQQVGRPIYTRRSSSTSSVTSSSSSSAS